MGYCGGYGGGYGGYGGYGMSMSMPRWDYRCCCKKKNKKPKPGPDPDPDNPKAAGTYDKLFEGLKELVQRIKLVDRLVPKDKAEETLEELQKAQTDGLPEKLVEAADAEKIDDGKAKDILAQFVKISKIKTSDKDMNNKLSEAVSTMQSQDFK